MMKNINISSEEKKENPAVTIQSKRMTWNSRRRHNYKYITTVF
jgi:hypothetical protein